MDWKGRGEQSQNVEDRRGSSGGGVAEKHRAYSALSWLWSAAHITAWI